MAKTRWWFQIFLEFSPRTLGKMNPFWLAHIFQMGWFNHQLEKFESWGSTTRCESSTHRCGGKTLDRSNSRQFPVKRWPWKLPQAFITTVDGWNPIPNHLGFHKTLVNNGINYLSQLVIAEFFGGFREHVWFQWSFGFQSWADFGSVGWEKSHLRSVLVKFRIVKWNK